MRFYADLHIHSKYSRACSRDLDLEHLSWWAQRKGISVLGTGDFTHPAWLAALRETLVPAEPGLYRLPEETERSITERLPPACRGTVRFMLSVEISTIYKRGDKTRKIHHLLYAPTLDAAEAITRRLGRIGNLTADGRPILGLDSRDLLEITLEGGEGCYLVPAHVWTPWFGLLGSKSGFDAVQECYADLSDHIFALETGLSADPEMLWRLSILDRYQVVSNSDAHSPPALGREATVFDTEVDYFAILRALRTGAGLAGTIEFFPEEGKYHLDGHRTCQVRMEPPETRSRGGSCPVCGKPVTVGVLHRVEELADRAEGARSDGAAGFRSLVPLPEIMGEVLGVGARSKRVTRELDALHERLGPELPLLEAVPLEEIAQAGGALLAEAVGRLRRGEVVREAGYDGEYGVIRVFDPAELRQQTAGETLFEPPEPEPAPAARPAHPATRPAAGPGQDLPEGAAGVAGRPDGELPAGLDPDQEAAAAVTAGPLLIVAGPGTGKTRTLTHRIARLITDHGVAPQDVLAITFTRRAAGELQERLDELLADHAGGRAGMPLVATFHALGLLIVREQRAALGLGESVRVADEADRLQVARRLGGQASSGGRAARRLLDQVAGYKRARAALRAAAAQEQAGQAKPRDGHQPVGGLEPPAEPGTAELAARYQDALRERGLIDLDDLLILPVELLAADPDLAAAYRRRWPHISVDEYQDVDELQYRLLRLLCPPDGNLCAIGDPDQAIYAFRGAHVGFFLRFQQDFPAATVVHLTRNYRSSRAIVDAALQAIAPATLVRGRELRAVGTTAAGARVTVHEAASEQAEAEFVVATIERLLGGSSFHAMDTGRADGAGVAALSFADLAVLYRTDAQAAPLMEAFTRAGMPVQKRSHDRLADRPGVKAILTALQRDHDHHGLIELAGGGAGQAGVPLGRGSRREARPASRAALSLPQSAPDEGIRPERAPRGRGPGAEPLVSVRRGQMSGPESENHALAERLRAAARAALDTQQAAADGDPAAAAAVAADVHPALELLLPLAARSGGDQERFLAELALGAEVDAWDPRADRVSLLTLHAAKGLEFPVVFITGCEDGLLPLRFGGTLTEEELGEERRLFFVGLTRARSHLFLTHARKRARHGQLQETTPSPFLTDIDAALLEQHRATARPATRKPRHPEADQLSLL